MGGDQVSIWTVIVTVVTVLGSASAWRFYEKRAMRKERDDEFIRHDCRNRIAKLEALLEESSKEKDDMRKTILLLTEKVSALTVKVEFLEKENSELLDEIRKSNL
jgi:septal ring factor EnvC (AmiA/AmiB activator)